MKKALINFLKIAIPLLIGIYIFNYFWSSFDKEQKDNFFLVFEEANYLWILLALFLGGVSHYARAVRWKYNLRPLGHNPSNFNSYNAIMIGYIVNILVPRMGEVSRAAILNRTEEVPFDKGFGTIVAERIIDLVCLASITGLAVVFNYDNVMDFFELMTQDKTEEKGSTSILLILGIAFGIIAVAVLAFYLLNEKFRNKINGFVNGLKEGVLSIFKMKDRVPYIAYTMLIWVCYLLMFWVCFYACDFTSGISFDGVVIGFVAGVLGFIVTQGGIGTYPIMVGAAVAFSLEPQLLAEGTEQLGKFTGFGMLVWASQTILIVVLGLISLGMVQMGAKKKIEQ